MTKVKTVCYSALAAALYFVASCSLRIPMFGHITVDCGYIILMMFCVLSPKIGITPSIVCGAIGCALESTLMSPLGFSVGCFIMNLIISVGVAWMCEKSNNNVWVVTIAIFYCVFIGVMAKAGIECVLYSIPIAVKIPKSLIAFAIDSFMMIIGYALGIVIYD